MLPFIAPIIGAIGKIAGSWLETRKVKAEGKIAIAKSKVDFKIAQYTARASMDLASVNDMRFSWKDEYLVLVIFVPIMMAFVPYLAPYALAGFAVVQTMPAWYQWAVTGIIAATFGIRTFKGWNK